MFTFSPFASRRTLVAGALLSLAFATTIHAQTTGVVGINDYVVATTATGSTSCTTVPLLGGGVIPFTLSAGVPGLSTVFFFTFGCPCVPCVLPFAPSTCAIPYTACINTAGVAGSNQSFDLGVAGPCVLVSVPLVTGPSGIATIAVPLPGGLLFSTQAVTASHPCAPSSLPVLFSQSYTVTT